jgi:hypothetical protein
MNKIKILGGGIAGLCAAIKLAQWGFKVEVHEKKDSCGKLTNDFQFLENWTFDRDAIDFLLDVNISTDFYVKPWSACDFYSPSLQKYEGKARRILMYLVKRGSAPDSIDSALLRQAILNNVRVHFKSNMVSQEADIIATGCREPSWLANGVKFPLIHQDKSIALLNNDLSAQAYSYFIVNDNTAEIVCVNSIGTEDQGLRLQSTIEVFENLLKLKIPETYERFAAPVDFHFRKPPRSGKSLLVGEAAGFQDYLFGFGMVFAFLSGYLAAKSIKEGKDYEQLCANFFGPQLKIGLTNRRFFESLSNKQFENMIKILNSQNIIVRKIRGGDDLYDILHRLYNNSFSFWVRRLIP